MKQQLILSILRNPYGRSCQEIKDAGLAAADEIERLQREISKGRAGQEESSVGKKSPPILPGNRAV
jgi:hypothetical protein